MKLRTIKYMIKEGIVNIYRNMLMSIASISIVWISLSVFGAFLIFSMITSHNIEIFSRQPQMRAYCEIDLDDAQVDFIEERIRINNRISEYRRVTRKEALEEARRMLGENETVLEGLDETIFPVSFVIQVTNPADSQLVSQQLMQIMGIEQVEYSQQTIDFLIRISSWVRITSISIIILLLFAAVIIISNTIKLTMFARRREINIMKYIGATDWFIRWPFIFEGVIIGVIGSGVSFLTISTLYKRFYERLVINSFSIELLPMEEMLREVLVFYILISVVVGAFGSAVSIKKYLRV